MRAVLIVVVLLAIGLAVTVIASRKRLASRRRKKHMADQAQHVAELAAENERMDYFLDKISGNTDDPVGIYDLRDRERKGPPKRRR